MKTISILGSTGSVGCATVDLIKEMRDEYIVDSLTAHQNWQLLAEQAKILKPRYVAVSKHEYYQPLKSALVGQNTQVASGEKAIIEARRKRGRFVNGSYRWYGWLASYSGRYKKGYDGGISQ